MDKVQKPSNSEYYTPFSERFRAYLNLGDLLEHLLVVESMILKRILRNEDSKMWTGICGLRVVYKDGFLSLEQWNFVFQKSIIVLIG
jgi:hypothetical protein